MLETDEIQKAVMYDEILKVSVEKLEKESGEPLIGAVLQLWKLPDIQKGETDPLYSIVEVSEGNTLNQGPELIMEWETDGKVQEFRGLQSGTYLLREVKAPEGYSLAEDIFFSVTRKEKEDIQIVMEDERIPKELKESEEPEELEEPEESEEPEEPERPQEPEWPVKPDQPEELEHPATGDDGIILPAVIMAAAVLIVAASIACIRKRRKEKDDTAFPR